jgi:nucleotide-binding universal stress UspA family protein
VTARIVVGVDGSDESRAALAWALQQAHTVGARLDVVHVWHYPWVVTASGAAAAGVGLEEYEAEGRRLLADEVASLGKAAADLEIHPRLGTGNATHVLLQAADGADLLVVGSRGRGGFSGLLLGSVSQQCAHHAPCPVVIVPSAARSPSGSERDARSSGSPNPGGGR